MDYTIKSSEDFMNMYCTGQRCLQFSKSQLLVMGLITLILLVLVSACNRKYDEQKDNMIFRNFEKKLQSLSDPVLRQQEVDAFIDKIKTDYPVFENDTTVVLLQQSDRDSLFLLGDMGQWTDFVPMIRLTGTNLFYYRGTFPSDARLEYWIMDSRQGMGRVDQFNPFKVLNGFGPMSELAMPGYRRHRLFEPWQYGKKGGLELVRKMEVPSTILGYAHDIYVYLPPAYEIEKDRDYPVVFFQDGLDYIEFAITPHVIDDLIQSAKIEPLIAVFITPPNRFRPESPNRMTEYGLNPDYVSFMADELVGFIAEKYRTRDDRLQRLVIGDSFGGLVSAWIPFKRPDVFALGYSQSGYQSFRKDQLIKEYEQAGKKDIRLYVDVGTFERNVGSAFLPADETDFLEANRRFKRVLQNKSYDFVYQEYNEGHTWGNWRRHVIDGLIHFFGTQKSN